MWFQLQHSNQFSLHVDPEKRPQRVSHQAEAVCEKLGGTGLDVAELFLCNLLKLLVEGESSTVISS